MEGWSLPEHGADSCRGRADFRSTLNCGGGPDREVGFFLNANGFGIRVGDGGVSFMESMGVLSCMA